MHSVMEIEEKIRQRYCQPTGVEQFGIEPVPPKLKTVRWHDIFAIIFELALNPGSMLVGGMGVVCGLLFWGAIGAITAGILLATIAYTITATVVVDYRLPGQVFDAHGLWLARCQMGAVVFAHNSFDVLVCLLDNGRLPRCRRDPRPLGRNPTFVGAGQRHLCRVAGRCGRTVRSRRAGCAQHRR